MSYQLNQYSNVGYNQYKDQKLQRHDVFLHDGTSKNVFFFTITVVLSCEKRNLKFVTITNRKI